MTPRVDVENPSWDHLRGLDLADPQFHQSGNVDLLLGADIYGQLVLDGVIRGPPGTPIAQRTVIGWIISGPTDGLSQLSKEPLSASLTFQSNHEESRDLLQRFCEIEEVTGPRCLSKDDQECERLFLIGC